MKKSFLYFLALALPLCTFSCKDQKPRDAVVSAEDSTATVSSQLPETAPQELPDEEMEAQDGMYKPDDIAKSWMKSVINVPGQKSDIVALFEAFYKEWPTIEGSRIVHTTNPSLAPDETYYEEGSVINRKNGYVESAWYEGEPLGVISACVWNRKNGHKLFAVNFSCENDFLCFYDFDPAKRTLTPEESPVKRANQVYPDKAPLMYTLPEEGKRLEVVEDAPGDEVVSTYYDFDGQNLKFMGRRIDSRDD